jgi:hypothetical protein
MEEGKNTVHNRPESTESIVSIGRIESMFPTPPKPRASVRRTLPRLPSMPSLMELPSPTEASTNTSGNVGSSLDAKTKAPSEATAEEHMSMDTEALEELLGLPKGTGEMLNETRAPIPIAKDPVYLPRPPPPIPIEPRPIMRDIPRPMTASTKRLSFSSLDSRRIVKYGTGKYRGIELSPQPSNDPEDPLVRRKLDTVLCTKLF